MRILIPWNHIELTLMKLDIIFTMTPNRWKKDFNAIGIVPNSEKYSKDTFAHSYIAFEFASWLSPEFKLYLIHKKELNNTTWY